MLRLAIACMLSLLLAISSAAAQTPGVFSGAGEIADEAAAICSAVIFDGQSFDSALADRPWRPVTPRAAGSNLATHAWRALTLNDTYIMRLPNGGCSFGVEDGDGEMLRARVMERLGAHAELLQVLQEETRGGRATRYAYCTGGEYPHVVSMVVGRGSSRPHFVFNLFRASDPAPSFCLAPI